MRFEGDAHPAAAAAAAIGFPRPAFPARNEGTLAAHTLAVGHQRL